MSIFIARNPKDVAVSFYHLNRLFRTQGYLRDFPKYWDYFKRGLQPWTPYWSHVQEGWEMRNETNLLFMFYENMTKDLRKCITQVSTFLGVKYSNKQYEALEKHLKIENFRNNKSVNAYLLRDLGIIKSNEENFVRKGISGGWKDYFVEELNCEADAWIEKNLKKTDLKFPQF
ncbi:estrogen sulfotransferase [Asbolus verrucosus]|uniref:Estrogen sulfotransferase n=1 Tax=Asbolus verrucosus TaxID=1661398 RepID=A0A482VVS0_ASBVE|nr:estrogen sulfotransferase [Asbolus verrucosus]